MEMIKLTDENIGWVSDICRSQQSKLEKKYKMCKIDAIEGEAS
jgi:hypothetical protein